MIGKENHTAKKKTNLAAALGSNASVPPSALQHRYNKTGRNEQKQSRQCLFDADAAIDKAMSDEVTEKQ